MRANLQEPFAAIHGRLSMHGEYYSRVLNGKNILQRRPNRSKHVASEKEKQSQERFKMTCPGTLWKMNYASGSETGNGRRVVAE